MLKQHKYYRKIDIDYNAINDLPEDGNLPDLSDIKSSSVIEKESFLQDTDEDAHNAELFVPIAAQKLTEIEAIKECILERQKSVDQMTVPWLHRAYTPVNEFNTEGNMSCAFPRLFPTGTGDFLAPREHVVTVDNYFKHLVRFDDSRFARHPCFRYFALKR